MKAFRALAVVFAVTLAALTEASATTVLIDDSTDSLKWSINGMDIPNMTFPSFGTCGMGPCYVVTGNLIEPGSASSPESATALFDDFSINTPSLPPGTLFFSAVLVLTEAGSTPGLPPIISDEVNVTVRSLGGIGGTEIGVSLDSDFGETALGSCTTNCVNLGLETGGIQDITAAALASMQPSAIQVPGLTIQVISDATEQRAPEPSTLLLLAASGLALLSSRAAWRQRRSE